MHFIVANLFLHITGGDNGSGPWYLEESGFVGLVILTPAAIGWYRRNNCHRRRCPWLQRHSVGDGSLVVCKKHHPVLSGVAITDEHIQAHHNHYKKAQEARVVRAKNSAS